jgi:hypothetical protein
LGKITHKNKESTSFTIHEEDTFNKSNQSYSNILSPKRELNSCIRLSGKLHPSNTLSSISFTLFGITRSRKEEQPSNAPNPIQVTLSGIARLLKEEQPLNVQAPMLVTPSGITRLL